MAKRVDLCSAPEPVSLSRSHPGHRCEGAWQHTSHHELLVAIAEAAHVHLGSLRGERRFGSIVRTRFAAAWLMRNCLGMSYPKIGQALGGRDHTSALNACRRIDSALMLPSSSLVDHLLMIIERLAA